MWAKAQDLADIPSHLMDEIEHFFQVYKDLGPGETTHTGGFEGRQAALGELAACRARYGEPA